MEQAMDHLYISHMYYLFGQKSKKENRVELFRKGLFLLEFRAAVCPKYININKGGYLFYVAETLTRNFAGRRILTCLHVCLIHKFSLDNENSFEEVNKL